MSNGSQQPALSEQEAKKVGQLTGDPKITEKAVRNIAKLEEYLRRVEKPAAGPRAELPGSEPLDAIVQLTAALNHVQGKYREQLGSLSSRDAALKAKELIRQRMGELREKKERTLNSVLLQTKQMETTWRSLKLAYDNSIGVDRKEAKFDLVSTSKDSLIREYDLAGSSRGSKYSLIEHLLRDKFERFGANPYCMVVLPWYIEGQDVDFVRNLGQIGRRYRCPVVMNLGASLTMADEGMLPASGDTILKGLQNEKNTDWTRLVKADTGEEAEMLSYLCALVPSIGIRSPYRFQHELPEYRKDPTKLWRDGVIWAPASMAFAGKIESLGNDYAVHLMPAGKLYGKVALPLPRKRDARYELVGSAPKHFPLQTDILKENANKFWENGLMSVVKFVDTGEINIYGDGTLLTSPDKIRDGEPMTSLGVRLVHDHVLHYCSKYLYKLIGVPVTDEIRAETERSLVSFISANAGKHENRALQETGNEVSVRINPEDSAELLVDITINVKKTLKKVTVHMRVKKDAVAEAGRR